MGRSPEAVADHLGRWQKEKVVCPCKKNGDPSPRCKVHGRRRTSRDEVDPRRPTPTQVLDKKTGKYVWILLTGHGFGREVKGRDGKVMTFATKREAQNHVLRKSKRTLQRVGRDADKPKIGEVYEAKTSGRRWKVVDVDGDRITMEPVGARSEGRLLWAKQSLKGMKQVSGVEGLLRFLGIAPGAAPKDDDKVVRETLPDGRVVLRPKTTEGDKGGRRLARKARRRR